MEAKTSLLGLMFSILTLGSLAKADLDQNIMYLTLDEERQVVEVLQSTDYEAFACDEFILSSCVNIANERLSPAVNSIDGLQKDSSVAFYNATAKRFQVARVRYAFANHEVQIRHEERITKYGVPFKSTAYPTDNLIKSVDVLPNSPLKVGNKVCFSGEVDELLTSNEKCGWTVFNLFENGMVQLKRKNTQTWIRQNVFRQGIFSGERILVKSESLQPE